MSTEDQFRHLDHPEGDLPVAGLQPNDRHPLQFAAHLRQKYALTNSLRCITVSPDLRVDDDNGGRQFRRNITEALTIRRNGATTERRSDAAIAPTLAADNRPVGAVKLTTDNIWSRLRTSDEAEKESSMELTNAVPNRIKNLLKKMGGISKNASPSASLMTDASRNAARPQPNGISINVAPRPKATDRYDRHLEEMLWVGRWSYLRYLYLEDCFSKIAADCKSVLSFGCGFGKHEAALALKYPNVNFTGIDLLSQAITECSRKFGDIHNVRFLCEDVFKHDERYDFIYTIEVLEHIEDPDPFIKRLTDMSDRVLIMVPNFLARYDNPEGRKLMWDKHEHHHIGFSTEDLAARFERHGFSAVEKKSTYFENSTTKVRELMSYMIDKYPELVQNDMEFLNHIKGLFDLDPRCADWLDESEEGQGAFVYAERR